MHQLYVVAAYEFCAMQQLHIETNVNIARQ